MQTILQDNNTYHIFKVQNVQEDEILIHLLWGKQDFHYLAQKTKTGFKRVHLQIHYQQKYYDYACISEHGLSFEETCWQCGADELYIELPRKISDNIEKICKKILEEQPEYV